MNAGEVLTGVRGLSVLGHDLPRDRYQTKAGAKGFSPRPTERTGTTRG